MTISAAWPRPSGTSPPRDGAADEDEGEFAAGAEEERRFERDAALDAEEPGRHEDYRALDEDQPDGQAEDGFRRRHQLGRVEVHAHGDEENPEQQPLERVDRRLDRPAILRLRQEQARDEGAERHREAARRSGQGGRHDDEETGGHEQLRRAGPGHELEQGP